MSESAQIAIGVQVTLHYRLQLADGLEVESSFDEPEPLQVVIGDGTIEPQLEQHLLGLQAGAHERFLLTPNEAFGTPDPDAYQSLSRLLFDPALPLAVGQILEFDTPAGDAIAGTIVELSKTTVQIDFNHPLAGRDLLFEVQVLAVA